MYKKSSVSDHGVSNVIVVDSQDKPTETLNASVGTDQDLVASEEKILLQTAVVSIQVSDGSATIMATVFLDSASHRTFITDQLAKKCPIQRGPIQPSDLEFLLSISQENG